MKSGFYMTTSFVVGLRRSSKALPKAKLAPKNGYSHCLVVCCPSDQLQLSESQQSHYIWEVCSANQWDASKTVMPAAATGQQKRPNSSPRQCLTAHHTTNTSRVEGIGLQSFASYAIITWPLSPTNDHFFKQHENFLQGNNYHYHQEAENAFQEFVGSQSIDFYATGINTLISHW